MLIDARKFLEKLQGRISKILIIYFKISEVDFTAL